MDQAVQSPPEPAAILDDEVTAISVVEALSLSAAVAVGVVALVSLALAHLGHFTLGAVIVISAVLLVVIGAVVWRWERRPLRLDLAGLAPALVGVAMAGLFFFPGFQYGTGDRDPGAYIEIAASIQHHHSLAYTDDLVADGLPGGDGPGAEWPALWNKPGQQSTIFPQFYHLWPALLATAKSAGGFTGMFNTGPLLALIAVALAVSVSRRIAGLPGAWVAAVILPTNMLEVWQAKYPSAEIFGQMLFLGAVLGVVLAFRNRWRFGAAAAGALLTLGFLERGDGLILVLFGWGVVCVFVALNRVDARVAWFAGGLLALMPYALYQAYHLALQYSRANSVPGQSTVVGLMAVTLVVAFVLRWQRQRWQGLVGWVDRPRTRTILGSTFIGVCAVLVVIAGLRPKIFGDDYTTTAGVRTRTYDEISFIRLTWFFSLTGIAVMCAGIVYIGWSRWRFDRWMIGLATVAVTTIYCYHVRNSPYLMWSTRRFVTTVVPGMVLLMGCGAAGVMVVAQRFVPRRLGRPVGATAICGLLVGLVIFGTSESWPLERHNENGGSVEVELRLAALSGTERGVYLWEPGGGCCDEPWRLFGGPMMTTANQSSALMPASPGLQAAALAKYVNFFKTSSRPVFYIVAGTTPPPAVAGVLQTKVVEMAGVLPHWQETYISRPKTTQNYTYDMTVYRLTAAPG